MKKITDHRAKSVPDETIEKHTSALLSALEVLLREYPECFNDNRISMLKNDTDGNMQSTGRLHALVYIAAYYHDLGKANIAFQAKLKKYVNEQLDGIYAARNKEVRDEIPHGYLSPAFFNMELLQSKLNDAEIKALVNAVYYHHTRAQYSNEEVIYAIEHDVCPLLPQDVSLQKDYLSRVMNTSNTVDYKQWQLYAIVKGLLNRLDYAASAGNELMIELARTQDGLCLSEHIEAKMLENGFSLRPVQEYMKEHRNENLAIVASTGIGKTEAAFIWAGNRKLFYTLPLKISINAIWVRLNSNKSGCYAFENSILLHSDSLSKLMEDNDVDDARLKVSLARSFAYPVTVCTVDQLFTFVYKHFGSEVITATLSYSCVVIDEIQAYSPEIVAKLIYGLKVISDIGGHFSIITATLPPVLTHLMKNKGISFTMPPAPFLSKLNRHLITYTCDDFDYESIACEGRSKKVLIICNTVNNAIEVFNSLHEYSDNIRLLHSRFKRGDRAILEDEIMLFSKTDGTGIWITTQIVEASLDIDFDVLYTEMCPADNLLQRLGRCYRKREYTGDTPNVYIHNRTVSFNSKVYPHALINSRSTDYLQSYCDKMFSESDKVAYINAVYDTEELRSSGYYKAIMNSYDNISRSSPGMMTKKDAQKIFRGITNISVIDDETFNRLDSSGELDRLLHCLDSKNLKERIAAEAELNSHCVAVGEWFGRDYRCNQPALKQGAPTIYRIRLKYEFDSVTHIGRGLLNEPLADNMVF